MGLAIGIPVLLFMRRSWFPDEEKQLRASKTVGAAIRGLLRQSSSTKSIPERSSSTLNCQVLHTFNMKTMIGVIITVISADIGDTGGIP